MNEKWVSDVIDGFIDNHDGDGNNISSLTATVFPICDMCGAKMNIFDGVFWFTCPECGNAVRVTSDGTVTWEREIGNWPTSKRCENCGQSLAGGEYTAPWENGNNPDGYTICPHCGYANFEYIDD